MHQALIAGLLCFCLQGNDFGQQNAPPKFAPRAFNVQSEQAQQQAEQQSQQPAQPQSVILREIPDQSAENTRLIPPVGVGSQITDQPVETNPIIIRPVPQNQFREPQQQQQFNQQQINQQQVPVIEQRNEFDGSAEIEVRPVTRIQSTIQDDRVRPAAFQQIESPLNSRVAQAHNARGLDENNNQGSLTILARQILEQTLAPATGNLLPGTKITLKDALAEKADRNARLQLIKDYWKATVSLADFQFATEEADFLSRVTAPNSPEARALWQSEVAAAEARTAEAKLAAIDAQETLRQKLSFNADQLPVPSDTPWVGRYRTNFEEHASAGVSTSNLKRIDRILPVMWQLVQRRAGAVDASLVAMQEMASAYRDGKLPISELLEMHRRLRDQRIAFLAAVRDYNYSIADYAMSTVNANGQTEQVVAMLLYDKTQGLAPVDGSSVIRQASAADLPGYNAKSIRQFSAPAVSPSGNPQANPIVNPTGNSNVGGRQFNRSEASDSETPARSRTAPPASGDGQFSPSGNFNPRGNFPPSGSFQLPE